MSTAVRSYYFTLPGLDVPKIVPDNGRIVTQLPPNIVVERIVIAALVGMAFYTSKIISAYIAWPVVVLTAAFALYTLYKHVLKADPLVEAMYKVVGGKDAYDRLPEVDISTKTFERGYSRSTAPDGRKILIVKGRRMKGFGWEDATVIFREKIRWTDVYPSDYPFFDRIARVTLSRCYHQTVNGQSTGVMDGAMMNVLRHQLTYYIPPNLVGDNKS